MFNRIPVFVDYGLPVRWDVVFLREWTQICIYLFIYIFLQFLQGRKRITVTFLHEVLYLFPNIVVPRICIGELCGHSMDMTDFNCIPYPILLKRS
jgi:hypothetical protein